MPYVWVKYSGLGREGVRFAIGEITAFPLLVLGDSASRADFPMIGPPLGGGNPSTIVTVKGKSGGPQGAQRAAS